MQRSVDRGKKLRLYARSGITEYWIVDPKRPSIERCCEPAGERYAKVVTIPKLVD